MAASWRIDVSEELYAPWREVIGGDVWAPIGRRMEANKNQVKEKK